MTRAEKLRVRFTSFADAMLLTEALNQYYISGFRFADGFVVVTKKKRAHPHRFALCRSGARRFPGRV